MQILLQLGKQMNPKPITFKFRKTIALAVTALFICVTTNFSAAWAGESQDCSTFGDSSFICAPVSQLGQYLENGTRVTVSNGAATLPMSATKLNLKFTSNSANSGKNLYIAFFDISSGLSLTLPSDKCASAQLADHACVTRLDSAGETVIAVTLSGVSAGKMFKYQINGPAGFASGFVTTTYTSGGGALNTPEVCSGDSTTICAPITRLQMSANSKNVAIVYDPTTSNGSTEILPNTSNINFSFSFPSDYMNKFVFVQFFDITNLSLTVPGGVINSSTSCDPQPAVGRGCKIQIDSDGKAAFTINLNNPNLGSSFKYLIAGPNFASNVVTATTAVPPKATLTAGKGKFTVKIENGSGRSALVTYKVGGKLRTATLRIISDSASFNITVPKGAYDVKVLLGKYSLAKKVTVK
mgnify:CR=1 FL=1